MTDDTRYEILDSYSFKEFCVLNKNSVKVMNYYDVDDYGVPQLKTRLLIGNKRVGIGDSVKNLDDLFIHPDEYQVVKISFMGKSPYYKVCIYKDNEHIVKDVL